MTTEIVKVTLKTIVGGGFVLVHDAADERRHTQPIPPYALKAMGQDRTAYFKATWSSVVGWAIGERVEDQKW